MAVPSVDHAFIALLRAPIVPSLVPSGVAAASGCEEGISRNDVDPDA